MLQCVTVDRKELSLLTKADFVPMRRSEHRSVRYPPDVEEAVLRYAWEKNADDNFSRIVNDILRARLPNLVDAGYLCGTCYQSDCTEHKPAEPQGKKGTRGNQKLSGDN